MVSGNYIEINMLISKPQNFYSKSHWWEWLSTISIDIQPFSYERLNEGIFKLSLKELRAQLVVGSMSELWLQILCTHTRDIKIMQYLFQKSAHTYRSFRFYLLHNGKLSFKLFAQIHFQYERTTLWVVPSIEKNIILGEKI